MFLPCCREMAHFLDLVFTEVWKTRSVCDYPSIEGNRGVLAEGPSKKETPRMEHLWWPQRQQGQHPTGQSLPRPRPKTLSALSPVTQESERTHPQPRPAPREAAQPAPGQTVRAADVRPQCTARCPRANAAPAPTTPPPRPLLQHRARPRWRCAWATAGGEPQPCAATAPRWRRAPACSVAPPGPGRAARRTAWGRAPGASPPGLGRRRARTAAGPGLRHR
mmetsp:Transcript_45661/g.111181  ORF Transcript_45661/g.111181 Transcript_45661/m.111181 type:complete len:221 (-) Transcript_45661:529-1191(-)